MIKLFSILFLLFSMQIYGNSTAEYKNIIKGSKDYKNTEDWKVVLKTWLALETTKEYKAFQKAQKTYSKTLDADMNTKEWQAMEKADKALRKAEQDFDREYKTNEKAGLDLKKAMQTQKKAVQAWQNSKEYKANEKARLAFIKATQAYENTAEYKTYAKAINKAIMQAY